MEESKSQPHNDSDDENLPVIADGQDLLRVLMQKLESVSAVQEIETLITLILKIKIEQQELAIARLKGLEDYRKAKTDRRIGQIRQIIGLAIGVAMAVGGPFVLIYVDNYLGTFLMSIGFTTLGLSSGIVKSIFDKTHNKK